MESSQGPKYEVPSRKAHDLALEGGRACRPVSCVACSAWGAKLEHTWRFVPIRNPLVDIDDDTGVIRL